MIVAVSILAIAALAVISILTRILVAQSSSSHQTVARMLAESVLDEAALAGEPSWDLSDSPPFPIKARVGQNQEEVLFWCYRAKPTVVSSNNEDGAPLFAAGPTMGRLVELRVTIYWNSDQPNTGGPERGTQTLTVSRFVYDEV